MNLSREKLSAIVQSIRTNGDIAIIANEFKVRNDPKLKSNARQVFNYLQKIPKNFRRGLNLDYTLKEVVDNLVSYTEKRKRLKYERTLKNEVILIAMECKTEDQLIKAVKKISPFQ